MTSLISGCLITYNSLDRKDITKINHYLFGRLATIKKNKYQSERYYYPGFLERTEFVRMSNGCYFVPKDIRDEIDIKYMFLIKIRPATIEFDTVEFETAREHWSKRIEDKSIIRNWGKTKYAYL